MSSRLSPSYLLREPNHLLDLEDQSRLQGDTVNFLQGERLRSSPSPFSPV
ncbi:MAG: hypothetical protein F6K28_49245, partial [Microcoleus sp. SIO2G3]|nr:hypothetical protein [Microcoleus sp. SIO2G3]